MRPLSGGVTLTIQALLYQFAQPKGIKEADTDALVRRVISCRSCNSRVWIQSSWQYRSSSFGHALLYGVLRNGKASKSLLCLGYALTPGR